MKRIIILIFARLLGAAVLLLVLLDSTRIASWMASSAINATQHVETYLHWFLTAKPAGIKLHPQTCWLLGRAGLFVAQQNSKLLSSASSVLAPALLGCLAFALIVGSLSYGLAVLRLELFICSLPVALPYAALATIYRWQLHSIAYLWRVFSGKHDLFGARLGLAAPAASQAPMQPSEAAEAAVLQSSPSLTDVTASILLLVPLGLLLPTLLMFYAFACALHSACLIARSVPWVLARALDMGQRQEGRQGLQLRSVLHAFAAGRLVGIQVRWPW